MDVEAFSDDNFDASSWINKTYAASENQNKENFVSALVSKLQLYVEQVNTAVEDTSQKFLTNLPRVIKDTQNLQNEALSLRIKMSEVQTEIEQVQRDTGSCMSELERLDNLKSCLQTAKQGLQESDGWGRLIAELDDFLERNDLIKACEKLDVLQKSLAAQIGLPGQSDRETQVEGFKNRVEALASPSVVGAFSSGDIEASKNFVSLFANMSRASQLTQYYRQVQRNILERHWIELVELSENTGSNRVLREFYDILIENYQKQVKWCVQVFGVTGFIEPILVQCEILPSLQPNRETVLMSSLKSTTDKLATLQEISSANNYFGAAMKKHLEANQGKLTLEQQKNFVNTIYNFFNIFISQYATLEQQNLTQNLMNLNLTHPTVAESIRALNSSNGKIIQWTELAAKRCDDITQNCGIASLVIVLNQFFKTYLEKFKKTQNQLRACRTTEQDWSLLQTCISFLHCIGDFKINLDKFEKTVSTSILATNDAHNQQSDHDFCYKIQTKRERNEFRKLVETVNEYKKNSYLPVLPNQTQTFGIFSGANELIKPLCDEIHDITLASVFTPMEKHLKNLEISSTSAFSSANTADLPDYSYAPQEYITQIGQYLLTLPQHLEPLLLAPSEQLKTALEICDGKYSRNTPSADILLSLIAEECCAMYQEQIIQICMIPPGEAKQLATDIEYLGSVLDELGLTLNSHLQQIAALLRAPSENYLSLSAGCDPKLVTAIRQMRDLVSSE